jgi:pyruvate dehydrogenase E2 component (dihydrolipoamide acetyltransferase)
MLKIPSLLESLPGFPPQDFAAFGETERLPVNKWQKIGGRFLARNWVGIPHVTHHDELDVTALEAERQTLNAQRSQKITLLPLLAAASVPLLRQFPKFNASLDEAGDNLILKKYFHVGIAVDTPNGLLVPVIRDCDRKSVEDIAEEIAVYSAKARGAGLSMAEMSGGCFTISSLGHIGGTGFTPIINWPEVAILGVCRTRANVVLKGGHLQNRIMLPVSLSYDHRVLNGVDAAYFTRALEVVLTSSEFLATLKTA